MYLSDLVKYVPFEFPLAIHFYPDYETEDQSSNYLKSCEKMTIIKVSRYNSMISYLGVHGLALNFILLKNNVLGTDL